jgi:(1->4)-alpha-D-glucan 1-alpha-D-glucosylmutase
VSSDRRVPTATYRLQLRPGFGFAEVAALAPYLRDLGVSHAYLSPVLQAVPGSTHGYDVVDHSHLSDDLGGAAAFTDMVDALHAHDLGVVVDVVPNHMAVPTPASRNAALWSVLREGPLSPYAHWFDIDWGGQERAILMPVLGDHIAECLARGEIGLDASGAEPVVRYFDHVFPVRAGTSDLPLEDLLDRQFWRLAWWRVADEELNYRRFFDVDTLAALRIEDPSVLAETHAVLIALLVEGKVDGLRIDHPDGLADPRGYLRILADATDGAWVVVEKILERDEPLPVDWPCAGTTGYDALHAVGGLLVDPAAEDAMTALHTEISGDVRDFADVVEESKRWVLANSLAAEVDRLVEVAATVCAGRVRLRDHTRRGLRAALVELLVAFPVYRAYVVPGEPAPDVAVALVLEAAAVARDRLAPERHQTLDVLVDLVLGRLGRGRHEDEFCVRFQQTCGPVMAKGVEDTAFYRWVRLGSANEVGGDPAVFAGTVDGFHDRAAHLSADWPATMTTLSTHDTKRSEDVRARMATLTRDVDGWRSALAGFRAAAAPYRPDALDGETEHLLWQTVVGAWPIDSGRLAAYLLKATREAKARTTWVAPDEAYDDAVRCFAERVLADPAVTSAVSACVAALDDAWQGALLAQKVLALTMPGLPDVYQGCELVDLSLVDPDNRRPVDFPDRASRLARLDDGGLPRDLDDRKLLVTSRLLRLRREHPEWFLEQGSYEPLPLDRDDHVGYRRGPLTVLVAPRGTVPAEVRGAYAGSDLLGGQVPSAAVLVP